MAAATGKKKKKKAAPRRRKKTKRFQFQLSLAEVAGIAVVCFCLFLWMFLLGIWAGQTILLPREGTLMPDQHTIRDHHPTSTGQRLIRPRAVKKQVRH